MQKEPVIYNQKERKTILSLRNVSAGYDKKQILFDISLDIKQGETTLLVGSNGSGKSTLFKAIYGILPIWNGNIIFSNKTLHTPNSITKTSGLLSKGIMYIPQKEELFEDMSVLENLKVSLLHLQNRELQKELIEELFKQIPLLKEKRKQQVNSLSGGERKLVSLGMALMNNPKLLLLDEPLAGLSGNNVTIVLSLLNSIRAKKTTLLLIEHRIRELLEFSDCVIGLKLGHLHQGELNSINEIKNFLV